MKKPLRPTFSGVTATLALFVALGGSSYAAITITSADVRNGSLTGSDIRNESIKSRDVDNGSITGSDVKNRSVRGADVADASLLAKDFKAGELPAGPAGPAGPQGLQGLQGVQGPAGATNVVTRRANRTLPPTNGAIAVVYTAVASCEAGEVAVGGGAGTSNFQSAEGFVLASEPLAADGSVSGEGDVPTQWRAAGFNNNVTVPHTLRVHVICASP
jgi:hypothetical protein